LQRAFDFSVSLLGLILLAPLFGAVALAIKLNSRGPVFFTQQRVGRWGVNFPIYKFRSMTHCPRGARGPQVTAAGDSRVTAVGSFLRATKIDELPQLINVVRGDMALVGPRPEVPRYVMAEYEHYAPILEHRPGITCPATLQLVSEETLLAGFDEDPDVAYRRYVLPQKVAAYCYDLQNRSFLNDLRTILATVLPWSWLQPASLPGFPAVPTPLYREVEAAAGSPRTALYERVPAEVRISA